MKWLLLKAFLPTSQDVDVCEPFQSYDFIIFDEAHCETKEYTLALALVLHWRRSQHLRNGVKVILMSSYLRESPQINLITRTRIVEEYHLHHEGACSLQAPSFLGPNETDIQLDLRQYIQWVCRCFAAHEPRALVLIPFADFRWAAHAVKAMLAGKDNTLEKKEYISADRIHVLELPFTMETELKFEQDFVVLAPAHTSGSHVLIRNLAHVIYPHWVQNQEFDRAVSKQVIRDRGRNLASCELQFLQYSGNGARETTRSVSCTEKTYQQAVAKIRPQVQRLDAIEYIPPCIWNISSEVTICRGPCA